MTATVHSLVRPLVEPLVRSLVEPFGSAWAPTNLGSNLLQFFESPAYASSNIAGIPVLADGANTGTLRQNRQGRAYKNDGTDDYVSFPSRLTSGSITSFTACCWYKGTVATDNGLLGEYGGVGQYGWLLNVYSGVIYPILSADGSAVTNTITAGSISNNVWHHIAMVYDGSGATNADKVQIYLDGALSELSGSGTYPSSIHNTTKAFRINEYGTLGGRGPGSYFDCRLYTDSKTATEIAAIHAGDYDSPNITNLLGGWWCNEEAGTTAYDWSGNGNDGTITNATLSTFHATDTGLTSNPANQVGQSGAFYFDGTNDSIALPIGSGTQLVKGPLGKASSEDFSISIKYKGTDTAQNGDWGKGLLAWSDGGIYAGLILRLGYVEFLHYNGSGWNHNIKSTTLVADGEEHHIAFVNDGATETGSLYIDGVKEIDGLDSSIAGSGTYYQPGHVAANYTNQYTSGTIRSVRYYDDSLSSDEVDYLYDGTGTDPTTADLLFELLLNNGLAKDTSGNGNHGTVSGALPVILPRDESDTANDVTGSALDFTGKCPMSGQVNVPCGTFDGTDDYVSVGSTSLTAGFSGISYAFWTYSVSHVAAHGLMYSGGAKYGGVAYAATDQIVFYLRTSVSTVLTTTGGEYTTGAWHHVVATWTSGDNLRLYVDGVLAKTSVGTVSGTTDQSNVLRIGKDEDAAPRALNGYMCDARIYSDALTADEVTYLYTSGASGTDPTEDNLVGHWPFEEGAGNTIHDIAGDNHGTVTNATLSNFWANKTTVTRARDIEYGGKHVAWFDGTDDRINCGDVADVAAGDFTLATWVYISTVPPSGEKGLITKRDYSGTSKGYFLSLTTTPVLRAGVKDSSNVAIAGGTTLAINIWYHAAAVFDRDGNVTLYLNGSSDATPVNISGQSGSVDNAYNLTLGAWSDPTQYFSGAMRDSRVFTSALTADNITYLATNGSSGTDPGAGIVVYDLDGSAKDTSGNKNHGTVSGAVFPFIPASTDGTVPIGGTPTASQVANKLSNKHASANWNPYTAAELNAPLGVETAYTIGKSRQSIATVNTKFRRSGLSTARQFTAANSEYFTIASNASLQIADIDHTFCCWVYVDSLAAQRPILSKWNVGTEYLFDYFSGNFRFFGDGSTKVLSTETPAANRWYFLAASYSTADDLLYLSLDNASPNSAALAVHSSAASADFRIGGKQDAPATTYDGRIARVGFWKRLLTTAERTALYNSGEGLGYNALTTPLKTSLVSYWNLDEASGNALDSHGSNHLTDTNTVTAADGPDRSSDGDDRFAVTSAALTGSNLTNMRKYVQ